MFDMLDGAMARVRNAATTFGAFLDSTLDRYTESIILGGLLYYALQRPALHEALWPWANEQQWMIFLTFTTVVGSLMVSYAKARAEGLGLECKTGLLARPERVVILALGLLFGWTIWALTLLAVLTHVTAVERIVHVWRAANQPLPAASPASSLTPEAQGSPADRPASLAPGDFRNTTVETVSPGLPPLTGGVQHD